MPELPEVETIKRQLAAELKNKKIRGVKIKLAKLIKSPLASFKRGAVNARIASVKRRAKVLIFELSNGYSILVHLKMTGQLVYKKKGEIRAGGHPIENGHLGLPNKYSHIIFSFFDGSNLYFNDIRQFGYLKLIKTDDQGRAFEIKKLGPEPLSRKFSLTFFESLLFKKQKAKIKPLLIDQTFLAGLGNIYATEACHEAGVRPTRRVGSLKKYEISKLYKAIKKILQTAIAEQGTSSNTYVDAYGQPGKYVPRLKVYGRKGEKCFGCGTKIKAISLGGRGTAFCPGCQK